MGRRWETAPGEQVMAFYKYAAYLQVNNHQEFDNNHAPGSDAPNPGIYRCTGCGDEIGIAKGHKLPPQNHHQHTQAQGSIRWQLIVCAVSR
jgi:hypothetical protein